jgi:LysM repeat protein
MKPFAITSITILALLALQLCASPISLTQPSQERETLASSIGSSLDRVLKILFTAPSSNTLTSRSPSFENSTMSSSTRQNSTKTCTILTGETFSSIAADLGISVFTIESANQTLKPEGLQIGATVLVPGSFEGSGNSTTDGNKTEAVKETLKRRTIKLW